MNASRDALAPQPPPPDRARAAPDPRHPGWCDPACCTADPAATGLDGYHAGGGGQHRSAPIRLDLVAAIWPPEQTGEAYLTEAAAPWRCATYLRVRVGGGELAIPVDAPAAMLAALSGLVVAARRDQAVSR